MTTRIVFVCEGNVCRSPMAEALMKEMLSSRKVEGIEVSSCGLRAQEGASAHSELESVLGDAYSYLSNFTSRTINKEIADSADLLLAMENRHVQEINTRFPEAKAKTFTVNGFAGVKGEIKDFIDSNEPDIVDWMQDCYDELSEELPKVIEKVSNSKGKAGSDKPSKKSFIV